MKPNGKLWKIELAGLNDNDVVARLKVRGHDYDQAKLRASRLHNPSKTRIMSIVLLETAA